MKLADTATGWELECVTGAGGRPPAGGLVLKNITHLGHNFAKDVRLIGLWIETEVVEPSDKVVSSANTFYVLDSAKFTVSAVKTLTPVSVMNPVFKKAFDYLKEADEALIFTEYFKDLSTGNYVGFGVSATYEAPALLASLTNCEHVGLTVEQIFIFSRYGNSPKHEPSGGLSAARFHPMTRYAFAKNPAYDAKQQRTRIRSIRFDYRLYLYLDRHYDVPTNAALPQLGNQAGLFADSDTLIGTGVVVVGKGIWGLVSSSKPGTAFTGGAFDAAEKPLVLEVVAPGLGKGFSKFKAAPKGGGPAADVRCWDNIHWWGSRGPKDPLISAPGAFHCAHLHWRWGAAGKGAPGTSGDPHFNPTTYPAGLKTNPNSGMWGPLVDPKIWIQSIRVAVTKNDPSIDPDAGVAAAALSLEDWSSLFDSRLHPTPLDISAGDDLVMWYSAQVHHDVSEPSVPTTLAQPSPSVPAIGTFATDYAGTVFIHGIFFAHDAEKTGFSVGSVDPLHRPKDEATVRASKTWLRSAD